MQVSLSITKMSQDSRSSTIISIIHFNLHHLTGMESLHGQLLHKFHRYIQAVIALKLGDDTETKTLT